MVLKSLGSLAFVLAVAVGVGACSPTLTIVSWEPGKVAPHGARTIVLVDGEGESGARKIAADLLVKESKGGWFRVERFPEQVKLVLVRDKARIDGATLEAIPEGALWARVDVIEWDTEATTVEEEDAEGNTVQVPAQKSDVSLQITVADRDGRVLMREQQYVGEVIVEDGTVVLADPLTEAARQAANGFLAEAAPQQVSQLVRFDDTDGGLSSALKNITEKKWTLAVAERKLRRYLKHHENNAIATYDLAVIVDARGRHDDALALYDAAMNIHTRDYYIESRAGCARRATAKRAVFGGDRGDTSAAQNAASKSVVPVEKIPDDPPPPTAAPAGEAPPPPS